jgi:hypothetical protein
MLVTDLNYVRRVGEVWPGWVRYGFVSPPWSLGVYVPIEVSTGGCRCPMWGRAVPALGWGWSLDRG